MTTETETINWRTAFRNATPLQRVVACMIILSLVAPIFAAIVVQFLPNEMLVLWYETEQFHGLISTLWPNGLREVERFFELGFDEKGYNAYFYSYILVLLMCFNFIILPSFFIICNIGGDSNAFINIVINDKIITNKFIFSNVIAFFILLFSHLRFNIVRYSTIDDKFRGHLFGEYYFCQFAGYSIIAWNAMLIASYCLRRK